MAQKEKEADQRQQPPIWEWLLAAVGLVIVSLAIGTIVYRAVTQDSSPPDIQITVKTVSEKAGGFLVEFEVHNQGNQAASAVNIEGELRSNGVAVETKTMSMSYSPPNSKRSGGLIFAKDPKLYDVKIAAVGYENP